MREKKASFVVDAFEADIDADSLDWKDKKQQKKYFKKIALQIGLVIIEFNRLEWQLTEVLKQYFCNDLPELSSIYYDIVNAYSFSSKVELLKKFYKVYGCGEKKHIFETSGNLKDWDKQVDTLIDKLKKVSGLRNKYAHCFWHRLTEDKFVEFKSEINQKKGLHKVFIRFNDKDIEEDFNLIDDTQVDLYNLDSVFNEIYTST